MQEFKNVRSTAETVELLFISKDKVYVRENITHVGKQEDIEFGQNNFVGWEYDEIQYGKDEYIEKLANYEDLSGMIFLTTFLMAEIDMLKSLVGGN